MKATLFKAHIIVFLKPTTLYAVVEKELLHVDSDLAERKTIWSVHYIHVTMPLSHTMPKPPFPVYMALYDGGPKPLVGLGAPDQGALVGVEGHERLFVAPPLNILIRHGVSR